MKKVWTLGLGLAVGALLTVPALAAEIRAQIKSVDTTANTITVTEGHQDTTFKVTGATHFLNVAGKELVNGINSHDLRAGRRVIITYDGNPATASEVKLRPGNKPAPKPEAHEGNGDKK